MKNKLVDAVVVLSLALFVVGCEKEPKTRVTKAKIEPLPAKIPKLPGKKYPEQIKNRDPKMLLGGERGLDHVGVAVKDLEGASQTYQKLGFSNPQPGKLPNGLKNINFNFGDNTYLELVTVWDEKKNPWVASFIKRHRQGAMFLMLCAYSYGETANHLRRAGFKVGTPIPGRIKTKGKRDGYYRGKKKPAMWHTFKIEEPLLPGNINFITYNRGLRNFVLYKMKDPKIRKKLFSHPNTVQGMTSAWIAVNSVDEIEKLMRKIQLKVERKVEIPGLAAKGIEVQAGAGKLIFIQPSGKGAAREFLKKRGEGIIGLSFKVKQLDRLRSIVEKNLGLKLEPYDGVHGQSVLVPAKLAYDVWVEFHAG